MRALWTIAATEVRIGLRNRWVILSSLILLVFALILVLLGSAPGGATRADPVTVVVASLATLSVYLVPLIALLLSFDAIAGEIDRGTLQLVLASPVTRGAVLVGKFAGHLVVLSIAVTAGYGIAGLVAHFAGGGEVAALWGVARLIASSILLGGTFIAIGYAASATVRNTGTAAAVAVAIWLFTVVLYDLALLGGLLASQDGLFARTVFPWLIVLNPADAFRLFNLSTVDAIATGGGLAVGGAASAVPLSGLAALASPLVWTLVALGFSTAILRRVRP